MSRLHDMIEQLCPEGVPYRALGDLLDYEQPGKYLVASASYDGSHATPVLTAGQTFILGYTNEAEGIYPATPNSPVVIFDDFTTAFKWVDFPFKAKSSAMKMLTTKPNAAASLKFLYYVMQTIKYKPKDHARQWIATYSRFEIPVPPVEVQHEIVRILDSFASLQAELSAELEAEVRVRRLQYAHYRNELLYFAGNTEVEWQPMGQVGQFIRGRRFTKRDYVDEGGMPAIHYGEIYTHFGTTADTVRSYVRSDMAESLRFARPGDVILTDVGETVDDVGKAVAWLGGTDVAIHDHCYAFRHSMNPAFVSYYMQTDRFRMEKAKYVARTKVKTLLMNGLAKVLIPTPPLAEQGRVVAIMEAYEKVLADLSISLPAERVVRSRQYLHYRDRLLTFGEAGKLAEVVA